MAKALFLRTDDGGAFGRRSLPWKRLSIGPLSLHGVIFLGLTALTSVRRR
jgi:hypothetical protein